MTPHQQAMKEFSDFLSKLANGCHVQVHNCVYARGCPSKRVSTDIAAVHLSYYRNDPQSNRHWSSCTRTIAGWMNQFLNYDAIVLYTPPPKEEPTRNVRKIEL